MSNTNDWYNFYEPYIPVRNLYDTETLIVNYIEENYPEIIEQQFELYKEEGKYKRAGEFIEKEVKAGLKNPDSYYSELKKGLKKDINNILQNIKKLPLVKTYIDNLEFADYDKERLYLEDCLILGETFMNYPRVSIYLLWIFSTTNDNSEKYLYGSNYLYEIASKIIDNVNLFDSICENNYVISLDCYHKYFNIDEFLTKESIIDFYIKKNYPKIVQDQYESLKKAGKFQNQEKFIKEMVMEYIDDGRSFYHALINGKRKLDDELLQKIHNFPILYDDDFIHTKDIEKLNHIRLALQMGSLAFQKFPHLTVSIRNAIIRGDGNLEELSKAFKFQANKMHKEELFIEDGIKMEEYYTENRE
ncbi:TPA: hypothetical protein TZS69_000556 [Streptococcus suis]|nr:hypothetical protein [Streptococcus suis]